MNYFSIVIANYCFCFIYMMIYSEAFGFYLVIVNYLSTDELIKDE